MHGFVSDLQKEIPIAPRTQLDYIIRQKRVAQPLVTESKGDVQPALTSDRLTNRAEERVNAIVGLRA